MNTFKTKLKLVFLPLLILTAIVIIGYSFQYWLFFIELKVISLKENVLHFWMPAAIGFAAIILLIRVRVHLLKLDANNGKVRPLYYMVGTGIMCVPLIFLLQYLDIATGKLTALNNIEEITTARQSKFYTVGSFSLHKASAGTESSIEYTGKHNEHLNFDIFYSIPFTINSADSVTPAPAFLAIKYHKQLSGKMPDNERHIEWEIFSERSDREFNDESIHFTYLERMANTEDRDNFIIAAKKSPLYNERSTVLILKPKDEPFENRNGNNLYYTFLSLGIGLLVWFIMIIIPGLHEDKAKDFADTKSLYIKEQFESAIGFLIPRKGFTATPLLIILNTLVFIIMVFTGFGVINFHTRDLLVVGAMYKPALQQGEWWRLLTAMFIHGGFIHLVMNMLSLYLGGIFSEESLGTKKFLFVYFFSGIGAGLISMLWHSSPVVAVGASGAIFGLFGVMLAFALFNKFEPGMKGVILILLTCTAGYSLLIGFVSRGVDNSAHLGGLVIGFVLGCFLRSNTQYKPVSLKSFFNETTNRKIKAKLPKKKM